MTATFGRLLLIILGFAPGIGAAHLLNMTRAEARFEPDGRVIVQIELDLTVALGGALAYHQASQIAEPLDDPALRTMAESAAAAVLLTCDSTPVPLEVTTLRMPEDSLEAFLGGLVWPRAYLELVGTLPAPLASATVASIRAAAQSQTIRMVFDPAFTFEEPIALTLRDVARDATVTRWLIAEQQSPRFPLGAADVAQTEPSEEPRPTLLARYLRYGFDHILPTGLDHLLFVTGLLLGARRLAPLLGWVSMYTFAHSITLALAAFSLVRVDNAVVEPIIAFSIVWVAIENLRAEPALRGRLLLVFLLGLVHGLGFASALRDSGLPSEGPLWALLGFNLGVELGQLTWLLGLAALVWPWRRCAGFARFVVRPASVVIALIGVLWGIERLTAPP